MKKILLLFIPLLLVSCNKVKEDEEPPIDPPIPILITVTFNNYDGTLLESHEMLKGDNAIYEGEIPTKPEADEFTYEFIGWDKSLENIIEDTTFTAVFEEKAKEGWGDIIWF